MDNLGDLKQGYEFMHKILGTDLAAELASKDYENNLIQNQMIEKNNEYLRRINDAIDEYAKSINEHPKLNLDIEQFKGFVAEEHHAHTFNIDAEIKNSSHRAWTLQENGYGSVDITTNFGKDYGSKYSNTADNAEKYHALLNRDNGMPKYDGQELLSPSDEIEQIKNVAHRRYLKDIENRPQVSKAHEYVEEHISGKITDNEGVESKELTLKEAKQIAREAKEGRFNPEEHGYEKGSYQDEIQMNYLSGALEAGLTAATITAITKMLPELYKAIDYLIKNGEIDLNGLKDSGKKILTASGESFLRGSITYFIQIGIYTGKFGEQLKALDPTQVASLVCIIIETLEDSIRLAAGKISAREMGSHFIDTLFISSEFCVSMEIGGYVAQTFFPELPGIGYAIGSLLGCTVAALYNIGKKKLISICVDTGFACFGLVEQDYSLPEEVLHEMGIETSSFDTSNIETVDVDTISSDASIDIANYETVNLTVLKRGLIGVNKVGYVF